MCFPITPVSLHPASLEPPGRTGITRDLENRVEVDLEDLLPIIIGKVFDRMSSLDTTCEQPSVSWKRKRKRERGTYRS